MGLYVKGTVGAVKAGGKLTLQSGPDAGKEVNERPKVRVEDTNGGRYEVVIIAPEDVGAMEAAIGKAIEIAVVARGNTYRPGQVSLFAANAAAGAERW